jgi:hypothetical protein
VSLIISPYFTHDHPHTILFLEVPFYHRYNLEHHVGAFKYFSLFYHLSYKMRMQLCRQSLPCENWTTCDELFSSTKMLVGYKYFANFFFIKIVGVLIFIKPK